LEWTFLRTNHLKNVRNNPDVTKFHTFTGWLKRYRPEAGKPAFAQVRMAKAQPRSKLTVKLPSGLTVRGTDAAQVAELIKLLGC
jgi:hypothetical protein